MTYLELVRRLAVEVGASDIIQTLQTAEGEIRRLKQWIDEAWLELQLISDTWRWRLAEFDVLVPAESAVVPLTAYTDFYRPHKGSVVGGVSTFSPLGYVEFDRWFELTRVTQSAPGIPRYYTYTTNGTLELWPIPAIEYRVRGLYVRKPQVLANDFDVPLLPEEFHPILVYKAMMLYAEYESAPEIHQAGMMGYNRLRALLANIEEPSELIMEPLA
jgi:hypothetical protein